MSERRNQERRKWGRKVTYPFIDSDGVLVTKNRRRLVDRRVAKTDATEHEPVQPKKSAPPTLSDVQPSLDISESKVMELEEALQEKDEPASKIEASIKDLESKILDETDEDFESKADITITGNDIDPIATSSLSKTPVTLPTNKPEPKEVVHAENNVSIELSFKGDKYVLTEKQHFYQVGRDPSCDIIVQGKYVSRAHAKITYKDGKFLLQDNSFNGTYIKFNNGQKIHVSKDEQTLVSDGVMSIGEPVKNNANSMIQFKILQ